MAKKASAKKKSDMVLVRISGEPPCVVPAVKELGEAPEHLKADTKKAWEETTMKGMLAAHACQLCGIVELGVDRTVDIAPYNDEQAEAYPIDGATEIDGAYLLK